MTETKVYEWKCKKCGKEIKTLNEKQLKFLVETHERSCNEKK
jgi:PHP family Zn ribbon phosphoesterase